MEKRAVYRATFQLKSDASIVTRIESVGLPKFWRDCKQIREMGCWWGAVRITSAEYDIYPV